MGRLDWNGFRSGQLIGRVTFDPVLAYIRRSKM